MKDDSPFVIYKASAGSGKTHKLTGEYIKMVFNPENSFRNVLAVTFTNKATAEMRSRILQAISDLAKGKKSDYADEICNEYHFDKPTLQNRAKNILNHILNQYSYFRISTIDSFFQQIVKSFTYELGLNSDFTLELDSDRVITDAVVRLMEDYGEDSVEKNWILESVNEKIEKGNRWSLQEDLVAFSKKAFDVIDMDSGDVDSAGGCLEKFKKYKNQLRKIIKDFDDELIRLGSLGVEKMNQFGLEEGDFINKSKSGMGKFLINCSKGQIPKLSNCFKAAINNGAAGMSKDIDVQHRIEAAGLHGILKEIDNLYSTIIRRNTASVLLENINKFGLVMNVANRYNEICREQNLFMLSSTMPFLNRMVYDNDTPFIYEKIGCYLDHFMIDEFQDTSKLNWTNFLPLIKNATDEGKKSLIVGDVKQAIYRWRGGDWNLLDKDVPKEFSLGKDDIMNLEYNYRSCSNVIQFNNWFFKSVLRVYGNYVDRQVEEGNYDAKYAETFNRTYCGVEQKIPDNKKESGGYVAVKIVDKETKNDDYNVIAGEWVTKQIDELAELGYQPGDIAILVRTNVQGNLMGQYLEQAQANSDHPERYRFMSNETVLLGNNLAIRLIIAAIEFLIDQKSRQSKAKLLWLYFAYKHDLDTASQKLQETDIETDDSSFLKLLPAEFVALVENYKQFDIVQLCSRLIKLFFGLPHLISQSDMPFINDFEDRVQNFSEKVGSNLQEFLDYWNERGKTAPISMNEGQNAITIMTIHKAKGLQFKSVIIPYAISNNNNNSNIAWFIPDEAPFNEISPVPVSLKNEVANTIFKKQYYEERFMHEIDIINITYVALTRAVCDMRILTKDFGHEKFDINLLLGSVFGDKLTKEQAEKYNINYDEESKSITIGEPLPYKSDIVSIEQEPIEPVRKEDRGATIRIRCHSKEFFGGEEFDMQQRINKGRLYHHIFEYVRYAGDVKEAVAKVAAEGIISESEIDGYEQTISQLANKQSDWFSSKWKVLTEQSIMLANGDIKRPDRILESDGEMVVIDYKFTSVHSEKYNAQVKTYVDALRQLTDKRVSGYLWYVWPNEAVEVVS